jgi:hypothetical protein
MGNLSSAAHTHSISVGMLRIISLGCHVVESVSGATFSLLPESSGYVVIARSLESWARMMEPCVSLYILLAIKEKNKKRWDAGPPANTPLSCEFVMCSSCSMATKRS